ncbi:MAG: D-sedoheptulose 7-phosphate isomerase [Candidatus Omnitrophica bacterium]|nr:D-sedoheptulose 7-phosphate isomerase [Candidatus Omnitrophota bacterium]
MRDRIKDILLESIQAKEELLRKSVGQIKEISDLFIESLRKGGKVILFGNGGSAADAQHIAAEFIGRFKKDRSALAAIALTTNTSILTSLANDYGYEVVFAKQIEALGQKNDLAVGISTSGKAKNVILGIKQAKKMGIKTIALTGADGGELVKTADVALVAPSLITARIQEMHITIGHIVCELVEQALCQTN